jgi:hypothetical protein
MVDIYANRSVSVGWSWFNISNSGVVSTSSISATSTYGDWTTYMANILSITGAGPYVLSTWTQPIIGLTCIGNSGSRIY